MGPDSGFDAYSPKDIAERVEAVGVLVGGLELGGDCGIARRGASHRRGRDRDVRDARERRGQQAVKRREVSAIGA